MGPRGGAGRGTGRGARGQVADGGVGGAPGRGGRGAAEGQPGLCCVGRGSGLAQGELAGLMVGLLASERL